MSKTTYPEGSMGQQEQKNSKVFAEIAIPAAFFFHLLAFAIPAHAGLFFLHHWYCWLLILAAGAAVTVCIRGRIKEIDLFEEQGWPYIVMIIINMASAVTIGHGAYLAS